uniref:Phospholipid phosphatase related 3 n=1 Tax=Anser cygnoides TaxID=8845 RepID=A0A8B9EAW5_ANSCY
MPYVETNEELIPLLMLLSLAFAAPAASIMVGEGIVYCLQSRLKGRAGAEGSINAGGCNFNSFLRRTVRFVGVHVFGLCATALVTDVIQLATGYHAPFFLTVCKPNYTLLGTPCDANPYITQDICSGTDKHAILSARKTFPSQHATLSAFAAVYVSVSPGTASRHALQGCLCPAEPCVAGTPGGDSGAAKAAGAGVTTDGLFPPPPDVFQLHHLGQHQTPQAHPGLRLRHRRRHLRPDADHAVPQPPRRRLRGLPDRLGHRRLPGGCRRARGLRAACPGPADPALSPPQAYHAVGNFRAPTERAPAPAPAKDALRALTQRGHDSVYHQNKSVSTDELNPQTRLEEAARPVPREKNSLGSLKRASVDVDLLAPRSPMGKENMVTFSNTLPRVNTPSMDDPARRHMTIHVPVDASRSKQLITEWKQKSLEGRSMTLAEEAGALGRGAGDADEDVPPSLYPTVQARPAERAAMGPRVLIQPRPGASQLVHIPEESQAGAGGAAGGGAAVRAKWVMVAEKGGAQRVANPPRLMQVIAMSKQQSMVSVTPKHSETSSSSTSSDSSQYRSPSERDSSSIITIDAHAPHHPVVHLSAGNGPWEWKSAQKGPEGPDAYELGEMGKDFRGFRPAKSAGVSPGSSVSDIEQDEPRYGSLATINVVAGGGGERGDGPPEGLLGTASRESTLRRKPAEKDGHTDSEADSYYRKMQAGRRFKE